MCVFVHESLCLSSIRGQLAGFGSLLESCGSWISNSGIQVWWQAPLTAEPSRHSISFIVATILPLLFRHLRGNT